MGFSVFLEIRNPRKALPGPGNPVPVTGAGVFLFSNGNSDIIPMLPFSLTWAGLFIVK